MEGKQTDLEGKILVSQYNLSYFIGPFQGRSGNFEAKFQSI